MAYDIALGQQQEKGQMLGWLTEPLGLVSVAAEAVVVALCVLAVLRHGEDATARPSHLRAAHPG